MIIANPIYDVVFKYLMQDLDIARELLSTILGEEIISLEVKPQEVSSEIEEHLIRVFRLDFKSIIRTPDGKHKKVLIELQKARHLLDVMRFRKYLGENYRIEDEFIREDGKIEKMALPIITIYFLGFTLENIETPVLKVGKKYQNAATGEIMENTKQEEFVELLTHESYTIQIPRLKKNLQSHLERVLQVFSQEYKTEDEHKLDFSGEQDDPLVQKIVLRLTRAIASDKLRQDMDIEDEVERLIEKNLREKDVVIEVLKNQLEDQAKAMEDQAKAMEDKIKAMEDQAKAMEDQAKLIEELKRQLGKS
jgi:hypothetical protein